MIPAGLEDAFERFETLVRLRRDSDAEVSVDAILAFAEAGGIDSEGVVWLTERIGRIVDHTYTKLSEGMMLGVIIDCVAREEARLASQNA